jgi:nucleoside-diphosphate-sugar epimerase
MPDESALEELLSRPTAPLVEDFAQLKGDILVLGAGGKMGPSLCRLAVRASAAAGVRRRVVAVARFSEPGLEESLRAAGVETVPCDLFDRSQVAALPDAENVIFMAGRKFGTAHDEPGTWAVNAWLPGVAAERFPNSRLVAFSTGNVYPLWPVESDGPAEDDPTGPIGEYAQSALARERVLEFFSRRNGTPMAFLRINYAIEPRYGVLRDIADRVWSRRPVDLTMGWVNVIWQRDANAVAIRALAHAGAPPLVLNVTGKPAISVRWLTMEFAQRWDREPRFEGAEAPTALLSNAARSEQLFGSPETGIEEMIHHVAAWVEQGGRGLGKPTRFEVREGSF